MALPIRAAAFVLLLVPLLLVTGCSSFNRAWNKAAALPAPADDLTGRWQGVWTSEETGHTDKLRCIITRADDGTCLARFHAKYHTIFSFGYTAPLKVEANPTGKFKFSGEADLGFLAGGLYYYDGHADAVNFFSTYTSAADHGTFQMSRPN